jgi:hypothetical protein
MDDDQTVKDIVTGLRTEVLYEFESIPDAPWRFVRSAHKLEWALDCSAIVCSYISADAEEREDLLYDLHRTVDTIAYATRFMEACGNDNFGTFITRGRAFCDIISPLPPPGAWFPSDVLSCAVCKEAITGCVSSALGRIFEVEAMPQADRMAVLLTTLEVLHAHDFPARSVHVVQVPTVWVDLLMFMQDAVAMSDASRKDVVRAGNLIWNLLEKQGTREIAEYATNQLACECTNLVILFEAIGAWNVTHRNLCVSFVPSMDWEKICEHALVESCGSSNLHTRLIAGVARCAPSILLSVVARAFATHTTSLSQYATPLLLAITSPWNPNAQLFEAFAMCVVRASMLQDVEHLRYIELAIESWPAENAAIDETGLARHACPGEWLWAYGKLYAGVGCAYAAAANASAVFEGLQRGAAVLDLIYTPPLPHTYASLLENAWKIAQPFRQDSPAPPLITVTEADACESVELPLDSLRAAYCTFAQQFVASPPPAFHQTMSPTQVVAALHVILSAIAPKCPALHLLQEYTESNHAALPDTICVTQCGADTWSKADGVNTLAPPGYVVYTHTTGGCPAAEAANQHYAAVQRNGMAVFLTLPVSAQIQLILHMQHILSRSQLIIPLHARLAVHGKVFAETCAAHFPVAVDHLPYAFWDVVCACAPILPALASPHLKELRIVLSSVASPCLPM